MLKLEQRDIEICIRMLIIDSHHRVRPSKACREVCSLDNFGFPDMFKRSSEASKIQEDERQ